MDFTLLIWAMVIIIAALAMVFLIFTMRNRGRKNNPGRDYEPARSREQPRMQPNPSYPQNQLSVMMDGLVSEIGARRNGYSVRIETDQLSNMTIGEQVTISFMPRQPAYPQQQTPAYYPQPQPPAYYPQPTPYGPVQAGSPEGQLAISLREKLAKIPPAPNVREPGEVHHVGRKYVEPASIDRLDKAIRDVKEVNRSLDEKIKEDTAEKEESKPEPEKKKMNYVERTCGKCGQKKKTLQKLGPYICIPCRKKEIETQQNIEGYIEKEEEGDVVDGNG